MANPYGNRSALILECPYCGTAADHHVLKTDPKFYAFPDDLRSAIRKRTKHDLGYRIRTKQCVNDKCGQQFESYEMPSGCLTAILLQLRHAEQRYSELLAATKAARKLLKDAANTRKTRNG